MKKIILNNVEIHIINEKQLINIKIAKDLIFYFEGKKKLIAGELAIANKTLLTDKLFQFISIKTLNTLEIFYNEENKIESYKVQ